MVRYNIISIFSLFSIVSLKADELNRHLVSFDAFGGMMRAWGPSYAYAIYANEGKRGSQTHLFLGTGFGFVSDTNQVNPGSPRIPVFLRLIAGKNSKMELEFGLTYGGVNIDVTEGDGINTIWPIHQPKYREIDYGFGVAWSNTIEEYFYWRLGLGYIHGRPIGGYYSGAIGVWF